MRCIAFDSPHFTSVTIGLTLRFGWTHSVARLPWDGVRKMRKKREVRLQKQLTVRISDVVYTLLDDVSCKLGMLPSDLVRMILNEKLQEYVDRASRSVDQTKGSANLT